jgi:hypothetical protein
MLYIPPTQNPFLAQSMSMLQNIGMMYLGHQLKMQDQDKQLEQQKTIRAEETQAKLAMEGFTPVSNEQQMGDVGNGPPTGQVNIYGKSYNQPKPQVMPISVGGKDYGVAIRLGDKIQIVPRDKTELGAYKIGDTKEFKVGEKIATGLYTGNPDDNLGGIPGWKQTFDAPRQMEQDKRPADFVEYAMPDGKILHLRANEQPPNGARRVYASSIAGSKYVDEKGNALYFDKTDQKLKPSPVEGGGPVKTGPQKLPVTEQEKLVGFSQLNDTANWIEKNFDQNYVGPLTGRVREGTSKVFNDPKFVEFKSKLGQLRTIVYSLSGKQINETELKWLDERILPELTSPSKNFNATLKVFKDWLKTKNDMLVKAYKAQNYEVSDMMGSGPNSEESYDAEYVPGKGLVPVK